MTKGFLRFDQLQLNIYTGCWLIIVLILQSLNKFHNSEIFLGIFFFLKMGIFDQIPRFFLYLLPMKTILSSVKDNHLNTKECPKCSVHTHCVQFYPSLNGQYFHNSFMQKFHQKARK